ncbi:MAG: ribosome-associated translation inhibitor RaiA [Bacteroidaceae bacterium]|nr:ribosome-associated translation inhibitor RaiA [Bacteroidaceae bacterium]
MEIKIQALHFDATEKLNAFIQKKVAKLEKNNENITKVEVTLKVVKPETAMNKETVLHLFAPGTELHAEKVCDTFEEGVDLCVDILQRQLEKYKEKQRGK